MHVTECWRIFHCLHFALQFFFFKVNKPVIFKKHRILYSVEIKLIFYFNSNSSGKLVIFLKIFVPNVVIFIKCVLALFLQRVSGLVLRCCLCNY